MTRIPGDVADGSPDGRPTGRSDGPGWPDGFLWGTATAAHQVEGGNIGSDFWVLENVPGSIFVEPSGDACDQYRLYRDDIALLAELGFDTYRFSIEWARVEPAAGRYSRAALRHYADVLAACHEHGITPVVTLHHFTSPRWLIGAGGWESPDTPGHFAAYASTVLRELGSLIPYVCTINEANIAVVIRQMGFAEALQAPVGAGSGDGSAGADGSGSGGGWLAAAARELGTTPARVRTFMFSASDAAIATVIASHQRARAAIRAASPGTQVGITLALQDVQALPGGEERAAALWDESFGTYLPAVADDDFLGVQNYTRIQVGPDGPVPPDPAAERTQMGYEFYPEALEGVLRRAAAAGKPMIVTENGTATDDDTRRIAFVERALAGVGRCLADGLDVRGYLYWSALDNFEWMFGYGMRFGLVGVDRSTQERQVKPSARHLGALARAARVP